MLTDIEMMTISNLDFLHYMTAVSHEMSDEPNNIARLCVDLKTTTNCQVPFHKIMINFVQGILIGALTLSPDQSPTLVPVLQEVYHFLLQRHHQRYIPRLPSWDCCTKAICYVAFGVRPRSRTLVRSLRPRPHPQRLAPHPSCKVSAHLNQMCENGTSCNILN